MSKEIKDYLHLYLGRQVEVMPAQAKSYVGQLQQIDVNGYCIVADTSITRHTHIDYVKPILRDLSDMTEEEEEELVKSEYPEATRWEVETFAMQLRAWYDGKQISMDNYTPGMIVLLLSKGFDLFGLIPDKLAINAKDLKQ